MFSCTELSAQFIDSIGVLFDSLLGLSVRAVGKPRFPELDALDQWNAGTPELVAVLTKKYQLIGDSVFAYCAQCVLQQPGAAATTVWEQEPVRDRIATNTQNSDIQARPVIFQKRHHVVIRNNAHSLTHSSRFSLSPCLAFWLSGFPVFSLLSPRARPQ